MTQLHLNSVTISDAVAERIAVCVKMSTVLVCVYIFHTIISANAVGILMRALATSKTVRILELEYIDLDDEGARHVSDALAINRSIVAMSLHGNNITDAGGRLLLVAISANIALEVISLGRNMISRKIVQDIRAFVARNRDIVHIRPFLASPSYIASHHAIACHDLSRDQLNEVLSRATAVKSLYICGTKF